MPENDTTQSINFLRFVANRPRGKVEFPIKFKESEYYWLELLGVPQEGQVEKAFKRGTKLITELLSEGKIDAGTAKTVIDHFVEIYVEHKIESSIQKYLEQHSNRPYVNALRDYLENK
jgi:hypothetical protein